MYDGYGYTHSIEGDVSRRIVQDATAPQCPGCTEANNWFAPKRVELPLFSYFSYSQPYFSDFVNCISRILQFSYSDASRQIVSRVQRGQ